MRFVMILAALLIVTVPASAAGFPVCKGGKRVTCVVDGDTFWLRGEKIRVDGYDSPEMGEPKCARPAAGAVEARSALAQMLTSGEVSLDRTGTDRYGRTLAVVTVDGIDIADVMIRAGHARRYTPGQKPWC